MDVVKGAIDLMQLKETKVLLSIGGDSYKNWKGFNAKTIIQLASYLGVDGIEIDYEGTDPKELDWVMNELVKNDVISNHLEVWGAAWSTGAYIRGGPDTPASERTGMWIDVLKNHYFDGINIMAYDAGPTYNPIRAFNAYRELYKGQLNLGVQVPPEGWGGHVLTLDEVRLLANFIKTQKGAGICIWAIQKQGEPSSASILEAIKQVLGQPTPILPAPPPPVTAPPPPVVKTKAYVQVYDCATGKKRKVYVQYE
jgi:chitinase